MNECFFAMKSELRAWAQTQLLGAVQCLSPPEDLENDKMITSRGEEITEYNAVIVCLNPRPEEKLLWINPI